ncbi:MAG: outer membrane beta-barrel protein, partial [Chitinophagaceae bacterium]|nr:outer membrane beta-barrel protein [Chitinophagaceae bacterium]
MFRQFLLFVSAILLTLGTTAQTQNLKGIVMDGQGKPMKFATVSLLNPDDSTLMFFGISNESGIFEIKNTSKGSYLLQAAMLGYKTYYRKIQQPVANSDLGPIILDQFDVQQMKGVEITAERIPLLIKKDTVEYDAAAFKTKPDANTEDLLKKMPGIEVDRAGNIKAQGESVNKVFVDGKEFFGNDPKVATRNLPADAIKKVQVFDKKSDMTEFTGVDDGSRERTINLMLKDGKKQGYFGDVTAGGGTDSRYKAAGKLYRFRPESQFAVLGMTNNINRSGFSFSDYLNFSGGLQSLMSGGGGSINLELNANDNLPVDFGQPLTGLVTSGAAGVNYSYQLAKNRSMSISYLGNGANKKLNENSWSKNYTSEQEYITNGTNDQVTDNFAHRLNLNVRNDMDSFTQLTFSAGGELSDNRFNSIDTSASKVADVLVNTQTGTTYQTTHSISSKGSASLTHRSHTGKTVWNLSGNADYKKNATDNEWENLTAFLGQGQNISSNFFRNDKVYTYIYSAKGSWSRALGKGYFIEPRVEGGSNVGSMQRSQGLPPAETNVIDSLSPDFNTSYTYLRPGIHFKKGTAKVQYNAALCYEQGWLNQTLNNSALPVRTMGYVLPSFSWRNEYATAKHISFSYNTAVQAPTYNQLLSVPSFSGPLNTSTGNSALRPEYSHSARIGWMLYDQFSFTSLFVNLNGTYTHDKINRSVTVANNLAQYNSLVNVADDYTAGGGVQFGRPVSKLGIKLNTGFNERFNRGITLVNSVQNITTSFQHEFRLGISNKKKEHWDAELGGNVSLTDTKYALQQSLNNVYYNTGG